MDQISDQLLYRRQYLLVKGKINCPFQRNEISLSGGYTLYCHPDLEVSRRHDQNEELILLGDAFDFEDPSKSNTDILKDLFGKELNLVLEKLSMYTGRFVIVRIVHGRMILAHDATAARKIFYGEVAGVCWFSSHSHLLARVAGFTPTADPSRLQFYHSDALLQHNNANLGNTSYYDEIKQVMPNHYFEVEKKRSVRYWPDYSISRYKLPDVIEMLATMLPGYLESILNRYSVMLPVTAGGDSRLIMASTRRFTEDIFYYINTYRPKDYMEARTPRKLFSSLGIPFHELKKPASIDPEFRKVYYENNPIASEFYLPHIYNYYIHFEDKVNLPGNIASTPWGVYDMHRDKVTIEELTSYYQVSQFDYVRDYYREWMSGARECCSCSEVNLINLFYWEERMANWGNQVSLDKDIAQEDFNPFNSRHLNELLLSVPLRYNNEPDKKIHRRVIRKLWPELMQVPFNPSFRTSVLMLLSRLELFTPVSRVMYRLSLKNRF